MQPRPDISLLIPTLSGGGSERVCLILAKAFRERGFTVDIVVCRAVGEMLGSVPEGVRLVDSAQPSSLGWVGATARYIRESRPRTLLAFGEGPAVVAVLARRLTRVPVRVVVSCRNTISVHLKQSPRWRERRALVQASRWLLPWADALTGVSDGVSQDLAEVLGLPPDRVETVYNPVIVPGIEAAKAAAPDHPWLTGAEPGPPVVVTAGRLEPQKDHAHLLEAFAKVAAVRPARLVIFGEGALRGELEAQVQALGLADRVALPGFTERPHAAFARADLFVLSSAWEGLPNVLIEAMACGCPVMSTDCPSGPAEILEGGALAPLVPVGDVPAMAEAMLASLDKRPDTTATEARAAAFTVEASVAGYLELLGLDAPQTPSSER
ncbi:MAG: glycosyltransferase [Pseudomonadota bacterium]